MAIKRVIKKSKSIKETPINGDRLKRSKPVTVGREVIKLKTAFPISGDVMFNGVLYTPATTANVIAKSNFDVNSNSKTENMQISDSTAKEQERKVMGMYSKLDFLAKTLKEIYVALNYSITQSLHICGAIGVEGELIANIYKRLDNVQSSEESLNGSLLNGNLEISEKIKHLVTLQNEIINLIQS